MKTKPTMTTTPAKKKRNLQASTKKPGRKSTPSSTKKSTPSSTKKSTPSSTKKSTRPCKPLPTTKAVALSPPLKPAKLPKWALQRVEKCPTGWATHTSSLIRDGYTVVPSVFSDNFIDELMQGRPATVVQQAGARSMRVRRGNQEWQGVVKTMQAHIKTDGNTETVTCPLTTRAEGRYDMPLPHHVREQVLAVLENKGIFAFFRHMCPKGKLRAMDILMSRPGSERQAVHVDSSWEGRAKSYPVPHYYTCLIPLTLQDNITGGTRVWPTSHLARDQPCLQGEYVDCVAPLLGRGDGLLFDGLLAHCGMENLSGILDSMPRNRYFLYAAFSSTHDPNTEVTGF